MERHKGTIEVDSDGPGTGCVFSFSMAIRMLDEETGFDHDIEDSSKSEAECITFRGFNDTQDLLIGI